jgi:hypothetical protein
MFLRHRNATERNKGPPAIVQSFARFNERRCVMAREPLSRFLTDYLPLHPEVKAALDPLGGEELVAAAVQAGAAADCAFSADEFRNAMRAAAARRGGDRELSEEQLEAVAGGRKAGGGQQEYLVVKLTDVIVTSVSLGGH